MKKTATLSANRRILLFVPLPPPVHGAALRNKALVESELINNAFDIHVLPFSFAQKNGDIGKASLQKLVKFFHRLASIVRLLLTFKPRVVYFTVSLYGFALYRDLFYSLIIKLFNVRLVYHLRTQGVKQQARESVIKRVLFKSLFKNVEVICLSKFLSTDIEDVFNGKTFIVNNGIEDMGSLYPHEERSDATVTILFLSNLSQKKGILDLLKALEILKKQDINFRAIIVGNEVDLTIEDLMKDASARNIGGMVTFLGPKFDKDKYKIFRKSDIFVLPTHFEAFPGCILEAMQFELPVIATLEGAIPEIVDDGVTGLLVGKHDVKALALQLGNLIQQPELRISMGKKGRAKFETFYDLPNFEQNMKVVFEHLVSK